MTDEQHYKLIEDFANQHTLAKDIKVTHSINHTGYKAKNSDGANYEDCVLLSRLVDGADSFVFWLRRNNLKIVPELKVKAMSKKK